MEKNKKEKPNSNINTLKLEIENSNNIGLAKVEGIKNFGIYKSIPKNNTNDINIENNNANKVYNCDDTKNINKHNIKTDNISQNNEDKNNYNNNNHIENDISKEVKEVNLPAIFSNSKFNNNNNRISLDNKIGNKNSLIIKNENLNNDFNKEKIKLEEFTKEQIKILILYYLFIEELKANIELSKTSYECYLIHKNYMKEYKGFYLYHELVQEIQKLLLDNNIKNNNINKEEIIFNNLNNEYLKKIKQNENKYPKNILDETKKAQVYFKKDKNIKYPDSFEIINKNIYEKIKIRKDNITFNFGKKEYLINEGKIILKLDYLNLDIYEIIVGTVDKKNNIFISNYLYKYDERNGMNDHYVYLTTKTFSMFKLYNISKTNQKLLLEDINNNSSKDKNIGKIYVLNEIKETQNDNNPEQYLLSKETNQKIKKEAEKELILNQQIISNIKFLAGLYLFYKDINNKTIESNFNKIEYEKGYMINEKLFKIYSKFYEYNKLKDILKNDNKIKLEIDKNKNLSNEENIEKISNELIKFIPKDLKEKYINGFNVFNELLKNNELYSATLKRYNHMQFLFFDSCILVKENFIKLISTGDQEIQKRINNSKVEFVITDKKVIIQLNLILNVGSIDENYIFNPEIIFLCNGFESLKTIKNDIKASGYNNVLNKVKIKEKNIATYNNNNSILVLFTSKELKTEENYSSNKKDNNENFNSKNTFKPKVIQKKNIKKISKESRSKTSGKLRLNRAGNYKSIEASVSEDEKLNNSAKNMISALIDSEKVKKKTNLSLNANNNKFNKYYMLNSKWFFSYINLYNLNELYNQLINDKIIENIVNNDYTLPNGKLIEKMTPYIDSKYKNQINKDNKYLNFVKNEKNFNIKFEKIIINKEKVIKNYIGFILVREEIIKSFAKEFSLRYNNNLCECAFGDKKIFMKINNNSQNEFEIGSISNETNIFTPKYFYSYSNKSDLDDAMSNLLKLGYIKYKKSYLLFNNDDYSPIFDEKGNIIGDAILYNLQIKDYSLYQINEQLKSMIILYFNYSQLRYSGNEIKQREYYLFNEEYLKEYKIISNYEMIADALNVNNNIKDIFNKKREINEKNLTLIIKNSLSELNIALNELETDNNSQNINGGEPYYDMDNSSNLMYYNNFEMININLIEKFSLLIQSQNYKCRCYLISNYALIVLPKNLNNKNNCIVEVGKINNDNIFNAYYLMEYKDINNFLEYLQYIKITFGFETFIEALQFTNRPCITLNDVNNKPIGKIYNLRIKVNNNNLPSNFEIQSNNINYNNNNINNISENQNIQNNGQKDKNTQKSNNNNCNLNEKNSVNNNAKKDKDRDFICPKAPQSPLVFNSIKEEYPFHQTISLRNVESIPYMNSTLQCLCNIDKLVSYFKYHQTIENYIQSHGRTTLTYSFKYLVENLWQSPGSKYILPKYNGKNSNNKYFSPIGFNSKISTMNPLFNEAQASDAKDLVNFIIMKLHEELNKITKNSDLSKNNQMIDQTNHDMVLNYFIQNFSRKNKSIISDLFYAMSGTYTKCSQCNEIKYNFQNYFFLTFPLEEVRKFKIQQLMNSNYQNMMLMKVNIDDCFQYNEKIEIFMGENEMYCNRCRGQFNAYNTTKLYYGPEILIIILNREKGNEFKIKLEFTEKINLSQYFQMKNLGNVYNLIGVITHMGENDSSGHFIANAKSPIDGQWYSYNDDFVFKIDNFKQQIIDYAMPYVPFYQKEK